MPAAGNIQYLTRNMIDTGKWDRCISASPDGLIYAYSYYLDTMAPHWDALVMGDYEAVMPLPWNRKFGISYILQPFLTAQLGVFALKLTEWMRDDFFAAIPSAFRYIDISLHSNCMLSSPSGFNILRSNHTLDLSPAYNQLSANYNDNTKRNIRKAVQAGCYSQKEIDPEKVTTLALAQMKKQGQQTADNADRFRKLFQLLHQKEMATTYGVFSSSGNLLSSAVFFFSHNRAYYILVGNHPGGRDVGASHALIDAFIKDHAGKNMVLDFEGSDIPTLAAFYRGFGAIHVPYPVLRINRLPFFLKWLKS